MRGVERCGGGPAGPGRTKPRRVGPGRGFEFPFGSRKLSGLQGFTQAGCDSASACLSNFT